MRVFFLQRPAYPDLRAHIVAEVVAHEEEGRLWPFELVSRWMATRDELLSTKEGRRALHDWETGDDAQAHEQATRYALEDGLAGARALSGGHLRLVAD